MLRPLALLAVRQEQHQRRPQPHLACAEATNWSMITWAPFDEVAELRLPEHQRLGRLDAVAVLEAERRLLGERAVVDVERGAGCIEHAAAASRSRRSRRRGRRDGAG